MDIPQDQNSNRLLSGKTVIVGVTGGIAAYKSADIVSKLRQLGADVWVVMTKEAAKLVSPLTFRTLSKNQVIIDLFSDELSNIPVPHISITDKADLFLIAPATANIIGKIAQGIADDPLSTMVLASRSPKLIAPAMNENMWENTVVGENIFKLRSMGFQFIGPETGWLACGDEGVGRMSEVQDILNRVKEMILLSQDLKGIKVLITAGGTREPIDPVRFIGNRSSGKMGYAIAEEAVKRGAEVTLITAPVQIEVPAGCRTIKIETAEEMKQAVNKEYKDSDVVIMAAAVADYKPSQRAKGKSKKDKEKVKIELQRTDDILKLLGQKKGNKILIGFSLETEDLIENSKKKLIDKNLDLVIANTEEAFDADSSKVSFLYREGKVENMKLLSKKEIASKILDIISLKFNEASNKNTAAKLPAVYQ